MINVDNYYSLCAEIVDHGYATTTTMLLWFTPTYYVFGFRRNQNKTQASSALCTIVKLLWQHLLSLYGELRYISNQNDLESDG